MDLRFGALTALMVALPAAAFAGSGEVSVARGLQVSIVGGCNDCHTAGYNESGGKIDPKTALKGIPAETFERLLAQIQEIRSGWDLVKQLFMKASIQRKLDRPQCYKLAESLFAKEVALWETLLQTKH